MKSSFLLLFILLSRISFGQTVEGIITDTNHHPLEYVSVGIPHTAFGSVTDANGHFSFQAENLPGNDSIRFSMISFETKTLSLEDYKTSASHPVILTPAILELKEVSITSANLVSKIIGNDHTDTNLK